MYLIIFTLFFLQSFCVASQEELFNAILLNEADTVEQLLEEEPGLVHAKLETDKKSPLHIAALENCCQIIETLVRAGANIENKDAFGNTPLHAAVSTTRSERSYEAAELLINLRAKVNQRNLKGETPLNIAAEKNDLKTAKLLVEANANPNAKDNNFNTPLSIAYTHGYKEMSELFQIDSHLIRVFFHETRRNDTFMIYQFLRKDPKLVHAKDEVFEDSSLHVAIQNNRHEIVKILLERGADIGDKNRRGQTPLHLAAMFGSKEIIDSLIDKGADIHQKDENGRTPLHFAVKDKNKKGIVVLLLQAGASVNIKDVLGKTPLHLAAISCSKKIIDLLIEKGADINQKNENGNTPLHYAVFNENKKIVLLLLQAGAKINEKNNEGKTPLDKAKKWENVEIIEILKAHAALEERKTDLTERMAEKRPSNLLS